MLETIMRLDIPLYVMTSLGCIGGHGMLATNLTYRRMIRNTEITEPERKMADHVEIKRQASSQNEPFRVVSVPAQHFPSGSVCFFEQ